MFYNYQLHLRVPDLSEFVPYDYYQIINSDKERERERGKKKVH